MPQLPHNPPPASPFQPTTLWTHPVSGAKVDSLSKIVALVEATVVSTREGNDEFSCTLVGADNLRKKANITETEVFHRLQKPDLQEVQDTYGNKGKPQGKQSDNRFPDPQTLKGPTDHWSLALKVCVDR